MQRGMTRRVGAQVSRRKDGQRFRLMIEADPDVADEDVSSVVPCFTNPICVLSKRKHHHAGGSPDSTSSSTKRSRVSSTPQAASASAASAASAALAAAAAAASHGASLASIKGVCNVVARGGRVPMPMPPVSVQTWRRWSAM